MLRSPLWRDRDFTSFWASQVLGDTGQAVTQLALPSIAILLLHAPAFQVGLLAALGWVAWIFLAVPFGVWADRSRRRPTLVAAAVIRAVVLLTVPLAFLLGRLTMTQLYLVALIEGSVMVAWNLTSTTYLPAMVGKQALLDANSKVLATRSVAALGGPGLGGALLQLFGAAATLWASAAALVLAAVAVAAGRRDELIAPDTGAAGFGAQAREGFRVISANPVLRWLVIYLGVSNVFGFGFLTVFLLFAYRTVHLPPAGTGTVLAMEGVGALCGAPLAAATARRLGLPATLVTTGALWGVAALIAPLALWLPAVPVLAASMLLFGFASIVFDVNQVSMRMSITPDHLQGRMTASARMVILGASPLGAVLGGWLAGEAGPTVAVITGGAGAVVAVLLLLPGLAGMRELAAGGASA